VFPLHRRASRRTRVRECRSRLTGFSQIDPKYIPWHNILQESYNVFISERNHVLRENEIDLVDYLNRSEEKRDAIVQSDDCPKQYAARQEQDLEPIDFSSCWNLDFQLSRKLRSTSWICEPIATWKAGRNGCGGERRLLENLTLPDELQRTKQLP
jgi:hypothetical protein